MSKSVSRGMGFVGNKKKINEMTTDKELKSIMNRSEVKGRIGPNNMCRPGKITRHHHI